MLPVTQHVACDSKPSDTYGWYIIYEEVQIVKKYHMLKLVGVKNGKSLLFNNNNACTVQAFIIILLIIIYKFIFGVSNNIIQHTYT